MCIAREELDRYSWRQEQDGGSEIVHTPHGFHNTIAWAISATVTSLGCPSEGQCIRFLAMANRAELRKACAVSVTSWTSPSRLLRPAPRAAAEARPRACASVRPRSDRSADAPGSSSRCEPGA